MSADETLQGANPLFGTQRSRRPGRKPGVVA